MIVEPAAPAIAPSSSRLPSSGLGAVSPVTPPNARTATPAIDTTMPATVRAASRSRSTSHAPRATMSGAVAAMTPAWLEVVYWMAKASNVK